MKKLVPLTLFLLMACSKQMTPEELHQRLTTRLPTEWERVSVRPPVDGVGLYDVESLVVCGPRTYQFEVTVHESGFSCRFRRYGVYMHDGDRVYALLASAKFDKDGRNTKDNFPSVLTRDEYSIFTDKSEQLIYHIRKAMKH